MVDAIELSQALIRCRSVTPDDGGALAVVEAALKPLGFACHRLRFQAPGTEPVENLYARLGTAAPNFCFAGHTDVVPPGDESQWRVPPFEGRVENGVLYGRGAADMKSAVAAFVAATSDYVKNGISKGSISLLITGDEEGVAINGTKAVLDWMAQKGETIDHCLVGEPTSAAHAGDTLKIGRRGSMQIRFTAKGTQGHTAYPQRAINPIPVLAKLVTLLGEPLDSGTAHFEPSTLVFTSFDVGNPASNVSPAEARAVCNIRFNDAHTSDSLLARARKAADAAIGNSGCVIEIESSLSGVSFVTEPGAFTALLRAAVKDVTGDEPRFSTTGGTSDARFIKDHCPVAELGLSGATMHKTDECVPVEEVMRLTNIYRAVLARYFGSPP
jgi:succinyl-diaminopimelate desuccinylase